MLQHIEDPAATEDEQEVLSRDQPAEGAEPRDLALLQAARRMANAAQARAAAPEPTVEIPRPQKPTRAKRATRPASNRTLEEFHALLRKAKTEKAS